MKNIFIVFCSLFFFQTCICYYREYFEQFSQLLEIKEVSKPNIEMILRAFCDDFPSKRQIRNALFPRYPFLSLNEDDLSHVTKMMGENYYYTIICLLSIDIDKNFRFKDFSTMLHAAIKFNDFDLFKILLFTTKTNPYIPAEGGNCAIHYAASLGRNSMIEELIPWISINQKNSLGETALHLAVQEDRLETVILLIEKGDADLKIKNLNNQTPQELGEALNFHHIVEYIEGLSSLRK